jgi:hypothetical protein
MAVTMFQPDSADSSVPAELRSFCQPPAPQAAAPTPHHAGPAGGVKVPAGSVFANDLYRTETGEFTPALRCVVRTYPQWAALVAHGKLEGTSVSTGFFRDSMLVFAAMGMQPGTRFYIRLAPVQVVRDTLFIGVDPSYPTASGDLSTYPVEAVRVESSSLPIAFVEQEPRQSDISLH